MREQDNPYKKRGRAYWYVRIDMSGPEPRLEVRRQEVSYEFPTRVQLGDPRDCTAAIPPAAAAAAAVGQKPDDQGWCLVPENRADHWDDMLWNAEQAHARSIAEVVGD